MRISLNNENIWRTVRLWLRWLLAAGSAILVITGLGITEYQIMESATFGWLGKALAHRLHTSPWLWLTFLILLVLHIVLGRLTKRRSPA
jgi:hypothetical protein